MLRYFKIVLIVFILGCNNHNGNLNNVSYLNEIPHSDETLVMSSGINNIKARKVISLDSNINIKMIEWYHNNKCFYSQKFTNINPEVFSYDFQISYVDASLIHIPKIEIDTILNIIAIQFEDYPISYITTNIKPYAKETKTYYERNQVLFWVDPIINNFEFEFIYNDDFGNGIKEIKQKVKL